jgi:outer membrane protein assembly factor BamB
MLWAAGAAAVLTLAWTPSAAPADYGLVLAPDSAARFTYPFDRHIHRIVTITNPTSAPIVGRFFVLALGPDGSSRELSTSFPRNNFLSLDPGETQRIVVSALWSELDTAAWKVGGTYTQKVRIDVLVGTSGVPQRLDIDNEVKLLASPACEPRCQDQHPSGKPNASITGRVTDGRGRGLSGVTVIVTAPNSASATRRATTRRDGSFAAAVWATRSAASGRWPSFSVRAIPTASRGLESRGVVVSVQPGKPARVKLVLPARRERASYTLAVSTRLDAQPYTGAADAAGTLFAAAPRALDGPGAVVRAVDGTGTTLWSTVLANGAAGPLAVAPDGQLVAAATRWHTPKLGAEIVLFDRAGVETGRIWIDGNRNDAVAVHMEAAALRFSPDSRHLFVGTGDGRWFLYDARSLAVVWQGETSRGYVVGREALFSPDGARIYFGAGDGYVRAVDAATGRLLWRQWVGGVSFSLAASPTRIVVSGLSGFFTHVLDASSGAILARFPQEYRANDVAIAQDGSRVYVAGGADADGICTALDGTLRPVWDLGEPCSNVALTADGHVVVAGTSFVAVLTSAGDVLWRALFPESPGPGAGPRGFVWVSGDAKRIVVVSPYTNRVYVYTGSISPS